MTTSSPETATAGTVYDYTVKTIDGKDVQLSQFKGKKLLIVNVPRSAATRPSTRSWKSCTKSTATK